MALLQISEPGRSPDPHERKLAVGIDLGTTNSLVATVRSGGADTLPDAEGRHILPSVVHYQADGRVIVGEEAYSAAAQDPANALLSVKRMMGRSLADIADVRERLPYDFIDAEGMVKIRTCAGAISPVQASAEILKTLQQRAEQTLEGKLVGAVITVPAYFDDGQRQATKDAARLAGLNVLRLLNEPTAAAVAYGLDQGEEGNVAVFDLGGGTFDISILHLQKGVFEVLSTGGNSALGGDDFDHAIGDWIREQAGVSDLSPTHRRELLSTARRLKEQLTDADSVPVSFGDWHGTLTRDTFNELISPWLDKAIRACKRALRDAKLKVDDIGSVVMVGGSTRVPYVRERVAELFGRQPMADIDPDKVVAIGAAQQADVLAGNKTDSDLLLLDVIPLSLGLETMGGLTEKIIHRNATIPVAMAQEFTTYKDGQSAMALHVVQGERELVEDCRSLARFELRGIPPMVAGAARIKVTFQVDADGLLNVSAREETTGVESSIQVKPAYGLSDDDVVSMLESSFENAAHDKEQRQLREIQVEADGLLAALEAALEADGDTLLSPVERDELIDEMARLQTLRDSGSIGEIQAQIEALGAASEPFAARRMDKSINEALAGHKLDEFDEGDQPVAGREESTQ